MYAVKVTTFVNKISPPANGDSVATKILIA